MSILKVDFGRDIDRSHNISTAQKDKEEGGSQTLGFSLNSHLEANTLASKEEYETCLPQDDLTGTCYKEKTETINDLFLKTLCAHMPLAGCGVVESLSLRVRFYLRHCFSRSMDLCPNDEVNQIISYSHCEDILRAVRGCTSHREAETTKSSRMHQLCCRTLK